MTAKSRGFFRDNSLSPVFGAVFLLTLLGQALSGLADYNSQQVAQGLATVSLGDYVTSSNFGVDVMENWRYSDCQFSMTSTPNAEDVTYSPSEIVASPADSWFAL